MHGVNGIVAVRFVVDERGNTRQIEIVKTLAPDLDIAVVNAVKRWKFLPTTVNGKKVNVHTTGEIWMRDPQPSQTVPLGTAH
jgi:TonB family protein